MNCLTSLPTIPGLPIAVKQMCGLLSGAWGASGVGELLGCLVQSGLPRPPHPLGSSCRASHSLRFHTHTFPPLSPITHLFFTVDLLLEPPQIALGMGTSVGLLHCYSLTRDSTMQCVRASWNCWRRWASPSLLLPLLPFLGAKAKSRCIQCLLPSLFHNMTLSYVSAGCVSKQEALEKKNKLLFP